MRGGRDLRVGGEVTVRRLAKGAAARRPRLVVRHVRVNHRLTDRSERAVIGTVSVRRGDARGAGTIAMRSRRVVAAFDAGLRVDEILGTDAGGRPARIQAQRTCHLVLDVLVRDGVRRAPPATRVWSRVGKRPAERRDVLHVNRPRKLVVLGDYVVEARRPDVLEVAVDERLVSRGDGAVRIPEDRVDDGGLLDRAAVVSHVGYGCRGSAGERGKLCLT